jgi:pilus assembly protein CpaB
MIRLMLFGLAVALATAAGMLVYIERTRPVPDEVATTPVVVSEAAEVWVLVAQQALPARHRIAEGDIGWIRWPEDRIQPFFTVSETGNTPLTELEGLFTNRAYNSGEPLDMGALSTARVERLSDRVTAGMRAVALAVSAETTAGGFVKVDDYVDIIRVDEGGDGGLDGRVILENVRVLAVGASMGNVAGLEDREMPETVGSNPGTVTVELTPRQASILAAADYDGRLALALRTRKDNAPIPPGPVGEDTNVQPRHFIGVLQGETWVPYEVQ